MDEVQASSEKKLTVLLLCWLFGLLAVHRFYTGKYLSAGLQLLALLVAVMAAIGKAKGPRAIVIAVPFLWLVVDTMLIIMGKFNDREGKPIINWV
jgi:TM2 domain-containing membrane protein YozV